MENFAIFDLLYLAVAVFFLVADSKLIAQIVKSMFSTKKKVGNRLMSLSKKGGNK